MRSTRCAANTRGSGDVKRGTRARRRHRALLVLFGTALLVAVAAPLGAAEVTAAVAANFTAAINRLAPGFERATGYRLRASFGSTGALYAQIKNGAPFDVFLAADEARPKLLESDGDAVAGTRFTYAIGRLVLWSSKAGVVDPRGDILRTGDFARLAIANAKTAPYGAAAEQVLRRLGVWERVVPRLVRGENISQTFQFVSSGNAALGLVAAAQVRVLPSSRRGSYWIVPQELYDPLRQDAVLLKYGADSAAARAFLEYLRSPKVRSAIEELGYSTPP
jgi:molybdate transport system substrate-binding protein